MVVVKSRQSYLLLHLASPTAARLHHQSAAVLFPPALSFYREIPFVCPHQYDLPVKISLIHFEFRQKSLHMIFFLIS